jgi:hypothetical protein
MEINAALPNEIIAMILEFIPYGSGHRLSAMRACSLWCKLGKEVYASTDKMVVFLTRGLFQYGTHFLCSSRVDRACHNNWPLKAACDLGDFRSVDFLLQDMRVLGKIRDASPPPTVKVFPATAKELHTPVSYAFRGKHVEIVELLISKGASILDLDFSSVCTALLRFDKKAIYTCVLWRLNVPKDSKLYEQIKNCLRGHVKRTGGDLKELLDSLEEEDKAYPFLQEKDEAHKQEIESRLKDLKKKMAEKKKKLTEGTRQVGSDD